MTQGSIVCRAEAHITVTASLVSRTGSADTTYQGIPGYTYHKAAGELWRSRFDADRNLVVINNGHRDFVYAARNKTLKLRYICRLFAKELVLKNFVGIPQDQLLERPARAHAVHRGEPAVSRERLARRDYGVDALRTVASVPTGSVATRPGAGAGVAASYFRSTSSRMIGRNL